MKNLDHDLPGELLPPGRQAAPVAGTSPPLGESSNKKLIERLRKSTAVTIALGIVGTLAFLSSVVGATFFGEPPGLAFFFGAIGVALMSPLLPPALVKDVRQFIRRK